MLTSLSSHQYFIYAFLLLLSLYLNTAKSWSTLDTRFSGIEFRPGMKSDEIQISLTMAKNLMNPLGIESKRFIVAVDSTNNKKLYGWAQLRPIGPKNIDPSKFNAAPGSGCIEKEIDEEIWDDFEKDDVEFPNGFASLPWTKEFKEFSKASAKRREKRISLVQKTEYEKNNDKNQLWELASVYVLPEYRKKGIGSELIRRIMARHVMLGRNVQDVYLLTVDSTKDWYSLFGFELTYDPPASMAFEVTAGSILTKLLSEQLIAMQGAQNLL